MKKWKYAIAALCICWLLVVSNREIGLASPHRWQLANNPISPPADSRQWTEISKSPSLGIVFPYATTANFVNAKLYPCGRCFLRNHVAAAVKQASQQLQQQGYGGLRLFDCYRPQPIQQKMWNIKPDERYVANPRKGSDHNRGTAVDLTILDLNGKPLDMGTPFDEFSPQAHHTYRDLSPQVLKNRSLLKKTMAAVGFRHIDTEWWHYAWNGDKPPVGKWVWDCPN